MEENKSGDSKLQICRICIEILERHQVEELNPTKVEMFKLLNVELTLLFNDQLFLCFSCSMRLKDNVEFKMGRLRNIVFCKMLQLEDDTEEYEESKMLLCKLCSQRWNIGRLMPIIDNRQANNIDKDVIKKCFSEVDILSLPDLLICPNCMENLNKLSTFLVTCFKSNELIKDYVTFSNSTPLFLNMFDIFEFKLNRKKKNEENINLEIVKIENGDINNNIEYDCDVIVKEECDSMTIEECELPFVKEEYDDPIESVGFYVQIDTLDSKHKKEREYICHHCNFKTRTKATLVLHLLVHQNNAQFNCNSCEFVSKWKTSLRTHMLLHKKADEVKVYQCKKCPYKSIYRKHLRRHMEKHSTKKYYCDQCPYKTKNLGPFKTHNKRKHNKKIDIMYSDFEDEDIKLINERIKRMNKNYKCTYCPYVTHKCSRIKEHVTKHLSDDEVTWHYCDYCTFKSRYKASVNHHQKLHKHQMNIRLKKVRTSEGNVTFVKKEKSE